MRFRFDLWFTYHCYYRKPDWLGPIVTRALGIPYVIAEASHEKEEILVGEVDLRALEDIRRNWPFLRDRRIDSYAPITNRLID